MNAAALPEDIDQVDVSGLAWTQEELRKSLEAAHRSLRRLLRESDAASDSEFAATTTAPLRTARRQLHEGAGVLTLVGLPAVALLLRGSEALVQRRIAKPERLDARTVDAIHNASLAVLDAIAQRIAGQSVSPLALFPQHQAIQEIIGAERIHPADLWPQDWQWPEIPLEPGVLPRAADPLATADFESQMLSLMRAPGPAAAGPLSDLSAALAAGAGHPRAAALWQLAAGFFEAQAQGLLTADVHTKRSASRLLGQLRLQQRQPGCDGLAVTQQLARDLSFFCVHAAPPAPDRAPRLSAVRRSMPAVSPGFATPDRGSSPGPHDTAWLLQARKRLEAARDAWSAVAGGEPHPAAGLAEPFSLVADSLGRFGPEGEVLGALWSRLAVAVMRSGLPPASSLAMEVATGMLYLEAALQEEVGLPQLPADRLQRLAERTLAAEQGAAVGSIEPWMAQTCRRVSDRQAWASAVRELRIALAQSESLVELFLGACGDPAVLAPVPGQLRVLGGVLSVLDLGLAEPAIRSLQEDLEALLAEAVSSGPGPARIERVATQFGSLSLLIDLLAVQPRTALAQFRLDPNSGLLHSLLERQDFLAEPPHERLKMIGPLAVAIPAFNAYLNEADEWSRGLITELSEWALELDRPLGGMAAALAQSLEDSAAAIGFADLSLLARRLGQALGQAQALGRGRAQDAALFLDVANEIRRLLHQFAAGFLKSPQASLLDRLQAQEPETGLAGDQPAPASLPDETAAAFDAIDPALFAAFGEEARELLPEALAPLRRWADEPGQSFHADACLRALHTLKGGARLVGASDIGERIHRLEADIGRMRQADPRQPDLVRALLQQADSLSAAFEPLWGRWPRAVTTVRVDAALMDRAAGQAGEIDLVRVRLSAELGRWRGSLAEGCTSLAGLQQQIRELELLSEVRSAADGGGSPDAADAMPDPLALDRQASDRHARLQTLAAGMAGSVGDLATAQRSLQEALDHAEGEVAAQARLIRALQQELRRSRRVAFEEVAERLHQVVRQAAAETGKSVRLALHGGATEVDRRLLERLTGAFEHLLRNGVVHGIEPAARRMAAGKDGTGRIEVSLRQTDHELRIEFRDDGAGLDLPRIRDRAVAMGLIDPVLPCSDAELVELIYRPGLSTAETASALAGRGVGLDVLRHEVQALGGRIETHSLPGQGVRFELVLPLALDASQAAPA
jgi:chemosensory pili system protein ChpA (sensor histidine kinase/response regulator)